MRIIKATDYFNIINDQNVTNYVTANYKNAEMSEYNLAAPTLKEFRALYNRAQSIFYEMRGRREDLDECKAARAHLANEYMRYKEAILKWHVTKR